MGSESDVATDIKTHLIIGKNFSNPSTWHWYKGVYRSGITHKNWF